MCRCGSIPHRQMRCRYCAGQVAAIIFTDSTRSVFAALASWLGLVAGVAVVPVAVVPVAVVPVAVVPVAVPGRDAVLDALESSRPLISTWWLRCGRNSLASPLSA